MTEIFDVKGPLKSGRKEPAKGSNERRENGHEEEVEMVGCV